MTLPGPSSSSETAEPPGKISLSPLSETQSAWNTPAMPPQSSRPLPSRRMSSLAGVLSAMNREDSGGY